MGSKQKNFSFKKLSKYVKIILQGNITVYYLLSHYKRDFGSFLVMGNCFGEPEVGEDRNVDPDERRRQMAAAAEKRLQSEDSRGMKDPEGYKRKLEQREKAEQQANLRNNDNDAPLKWQVS